MPTKQVEQRKVWKLPRSKSIFVAFRESPTRVQVLENGSRAVHTRKADPQARYVVERGWLVEETFPAAQERATREKARRKELIKQQVVIAKTPVFKRLLLDLEKLKPREVPSSREVKLWAYAAPKKEKDISAWIARVRDAGGAATIHNPDWEPALCVVAGPPAALASIHWKWDSESLLTVFDEIDQDAGLAFTSIENEGDNFEIELERSPRRATHHAAALAAIFTVDERELAGALRKRRWRYESDF